LFVVRAAARAPGKHTGRPPRLTPPKVRQLRALRGQGESNTDLMRTFAVSRATVYRALQPVADAEAVPVVVPAAS
jgi:DNA invertase Pin-like site-specific DNA recombinase